MNNLLEKPRILRELRGLKCSEFDKQLLAISKGKSNLVVSYGLALGRVFYLSIIVIGSGILFLGLTVLTVGGQLSRAVSSYFGVAKKHLAKRQAFVFVAGSSTLAVVEATMLSEKQCIRVARLWRFSSCFAVWPISAELLPGGI
ncbi:hypothetical protein D918_00478 [Trichuris suis]|nr:hypothetical protein D918_00478 [Trichuris suis]